MFNYEFYLEREYEVEVTPKKYSEEEALRIIENNNPMLKMISEQEFYKL